MDKDTFIGDFSLITCAGLIMHKGSQINAHSILEGRGYISLGTDSVVGYRCTLLTSTDRVAMKMNDASPESDRDIDIGDITIRGDAFVGSHSIIMPGVTIGEGAVIGANSFVDEDIEDWTIGWGLPWAFKRRRPIMLKSPNVQV